MKRNATDAELLRLVEQWTGHRSMKSKLKTTVKISLLTLAAIGTALALSSCVTSTDPSGAKVQAVDRQAVSEISNLIRDLFVTPAPPVAPIVPAK